MYKRFLTLLLSISLVLLITGIAVAQEPTQEPVPEVTEESAPEPTEEPAPEATEEPVSEPTEEPTVEPTEEPTEEPTVEPTEEPAPEPTEEPVPEPTEEPTEEPAPEPTEEPSPEPTEEPAPEPTEEPTEEPAPEPTAEPTEEPTPEPTEEATAEPTEEPTVEPTVEPTQEPIIAEKDDGEIGTFADPGIWTTTVIGLQNLSSTDTANASLTLYSGGNATPINKQVGPRKVVHVTSSEFSTGSYGGVVSSNTQMAVATFNINSTGAGDAYAGVSTPAPKFTLPLVFRNFSGGWQSTFFVQNASSTNNLGIRISLFNTGTTTASASKTVNVNPNESAIVDIMDAAFNGFGSGFGYATVEATDGTSNITVAMENFMNDPSIPQSAWFVGVPDAEAGTTFISPLAFNDYSGGWNSGVQLVNVGTATANLTLQYTISDGSTVTSQQSVKPGGSATFYFPSTFPSNKSTFGGVKVTADGSKFVAINNSANYEASGSMGYSSIMANPAIAKAKAALPIVYNKNAASDWVTGIQIQDLSGAANAVTVTLVDTAGTTTVLQPANSNNGGSTTVPANGTMTYYLPGGEGSDSGVKNAPANFAGAAFIEGTGILSVLGSNTFYTSNGYAANLNGISYD